MAGPDEILNFWLDEIGEAGWYKGGDALDAEICDRFEDDWNRVMTGANSLWLTYPTGTLAYIVLTDQFSRNMFRGTGKAFASDKVARAAAKAAIYRGWDMQIDGMARQFFYMPLMHSECLSDQERCVRLMKERMPDGGAANLEHARAHREEIRLFGRFPARNEALGRSNTGPETEFLADGGYRKALEIVRAA
ncbi:putative transmembrane protein [Candidatus Rhodobacter oscarellae]|uniref:Putative transmembrane protein n=1 Tax=Candidatus Rhodobacter oscarellae TaxID=1675527 RepID=A0A0J9E571_9RHOB|nr:DUF924 family protein [Candidatus Rhodobacter lobularis]KMW57871.1 putative transmembrane protein [Candidatus Rhodobacter lobularis]